MFKQYICGELVEGKGTMLRVMNPANGTAFESFKAATGAQAEEALEAAKKAFSTWSWTPLDERVEWLRKYTKELLSEREYIVDLLSQESGKPYAEA